MIIKAVRERGTYDPEDVLPLIEEHLTAEECSVANSFLGWVHREKKNFGWATIDTIYHEWQMGSPVVKK